MKIKTTSIHLFLLIKSMTKGEKRYIAMKINRFKGDKKYQDVFRFIDRMPEWNPEALYAKFEARYNDGFWTIKNYVYRLILQSLNEQYPARLAAQIQGAQLLFDRGLTVQARKELVKARKLGEKEERFELLTQVYALDLKVLSQLGGKGAVRTAEILITEMVENRERMGLLERLRAIRERLWWKGQTYWVGSEEFRAGMVAAEQEVTGLGSDIMGSVRIQLEMLRISELIHFVKGDHQSAADCCQKMLDLFQKNPFLKREQEEVFLACHLDWVRHLLHLGKCRQAIEVINVLDDHLAMAGPHSFPDLEGISQLYGLFLCQDRRLEQAMALEEVLLDGRVLRDSTRVSLCYGLAWICFSLGKGSRTTRWINEYKNCKRLGRHYRLDLEVRILSIMIHFEAGYNDLVECEITNAIHFQDRRGVVDDGARAFLLGVRRKLAMAGMGSFEGIERVFLGIEGLHGDPGMDLEVFLPKLVQPDWLSKKLMITNETYSS